jgi:EAL domain-containing protein (putative c-di-GMP-specific phosphodiesterase class I)
LSTGLLELEITESILMQEVEDAIEVMQRLREAGIAIAIDDFGTGYSSLNYLKRFPISTLKVDRSFVRELAEGSQDAAIVLSTINLARSFGLAVVAEGVESEAQLQFLRRHQCDIGQGYHIARPMPANEFSAFLDARKGQLI